MKHNMKYLVLATLLLRASLASSQTPVAQTNSPVNSEPSQRVDIRTSSGEIYKNCKVTKAEPDGITIFHSKGVAKIPFANLSQDYQRQFNYNPSNSAAYAEAQAKQNAEAWKRIEKERVEASILDAIQRRRTQAAMDRWNSQDREKRRKEAKPRVSLAGPVSWQGGSRKVRIEENVIGYKPSSSSTRGREQKREETIIGRYSTQDEANSALQDLEIQFAELKSMEYGHLSGGPAQRNFGSDAAIMGGSMTYVVRHDSGSGDWLVVQVFTPR